MKTRFSVFIILFVSLIGMRCLGQECSSAFTSHNTGSIINSYPVNISGTAITPLNGHVWILAHLEGFNGWYPQGNGERRLSNNDWVCTVYLGTPEETGFYEIAIAVVNDQVNQTLNNWVSTAQQLGYPPIAFPNVLNNCSIELIRVEKR